MPTLTSPFTIGEPQLAGALAVFPVFGRPPLLEYRSFAQAAELGALARELEGGANVRALLVDNATDLPLLVYEGEEVLGAQQNRTFDDSVLVAAGHKLRLEVSCLEAGRWDASRRDERLRPSAQAADPDLRRVKRVAARASGRADQGEVWGAVGRRLSSAGVASPSAAMSDLYDGRRGDLEALTRAIDHCEGQLGAVAVVSGRPVVLDLVSRPDAFASLLPRLAQGYALDALGAAETPVDAEAAEAFLSEALRAPRVASATPGMGRALSFGTPRLIGSGLEQDGELIQLSAFPSSGPRAAAGPPASSRMARPSRRRPA